jgi:D-glycero-D-manno-heptose 1,7-bisphosphate phosphatase
LVLGPLDDDGIWCQLLRPEQAAVLRGRAALFLDRDGVLVEEVGYLHRPEEVRLIPGAADLIAAANRAGLPVVLITNQAGIGRGYYGWAEFQATQERIACRKPRPGMILRAAERLGLDLAGSWVVGDRAIDLAAGRAAGLAGGAHVRTGHGAAERDVALELATGRFRVLCAGSVAEMPALLPLFAPS